MRTAVIGFIVASLIGLGVMGASMWNLHNERTHSPEPPYELQGLNAERGNFFGEGLFQDRSEE